MSSRGRRPVDMIIPNLWLGNIDSARDLEFHRRENINVIINCSNDIPFFVNSGVRKYRIPVDDNLQPDQIKNMGKMLPQVIGIVEYHIRRGDRILVHCYAGMQRSAIVVYGYLCAVGWHPKRAFSIMRTIRPIVFTPSMNFRKSIPDEWRPKLV